MLLEAYNVLTGKVSKRAKEGVYKNGFLFASGLFSGIALNDLFRITDSDLNFKKVVTGGAEGPQIKEVRVDEVLQYGIIAAITILSVVTGKYAKEILPMAAGATTGVAWANQAERGGNPITILPF